MMEEVDLSDQPRQRVNSDNLSSEVDETPDPRIQVELERLNTSTDTINKLEVDLDEARMLFRQLLADSTHRIDILAKRLGKCVEQSRPYYDARINAKQALRETQAAAVRYERAMSQHAAAREMVFLAEEGLMQKGCVFDHTWQEMLNHATSKVNDAEREKIESAAEHRRTSALYHEAETRVKALQKELKRAIAKSSLNARRSLLQMNNLVRMHQLQLLPYFELKSAVNQQLEAQKQQVRQLEESVARAKVTYAQALSNLETISDEIHRTRQCQLDLGVRGIGVGAESPLPPLQTIDGGLPLATHPLHYAESSLETNTQEFKSLPGKLGPVAAPIMATVQTAVAPSVTAYVTTCTAATKLSTTAASHLTTTAAAAAAAATTAAAAATNAAVAAAAAATTAATTAAATTAAATTAAAITTATMTAATMTTAAANTTAAAATAASAAATAAANTTAAAATAASAAATAAAAAAATAAYVMTQCDSRAGGSAVSGTCTAEENCSTAREGGQDTSLVMDAGEVLAEDVDEAATCTDLSGWQVIGLGSPALSPATQYLAVEDRDSIISDTESLASIEMLSDEAIAGLMLDEELAEASTSICTPLNTPIVDPPLSLSSAIQSWPTFFQSYVNAAQRTAEMITSHSKFAQQDHHEEESSGITESLTGLELDSLHTGTRQLQPPHTLSLHHDSSSDQSSPEDLTPGYAPLRDTPYSPEDFLPSSQDNSVQPFDEAQEEPHCSSWILEKLPLARK